MQSARSKPELRLRGYQRRIVDRLARGGNLIFVVRRGPLFFTSFEPSLLLTAVRCCIGMGQ